MKNKLWIKSRIIISFSLLIIITVNIFAYLLYVFIEKNFIENIYISIQDEFQAITSFIDLQNTEIFSLPKNELEKIDSLNLFINIWNNDKTLIENYKLWFSNSNNEEIIFRWDYKWYNIIIGKKISDLKNIQKNFINLSIILNICTILFTVIISYFITSQALKPLSNLTKYLNDFDIKTNQKWILNNFWKSEIWIFTNSLNKFIYKIKHNFDSQKDFIQDVSHELKTPLMQIESSIELLETKFTKKEDIEKINSIKEIIDNINMLISNLWFILRWEEFHARKEKINMYEYLKKLIEKYQTLACEKNIEIKIENSYDLTIENNIYYLDRLFWNIILNAILYNNWNNQIKIIVSKSSVEIKDMWIWIRKEDLSKIYNRFYRNNNSKLYYKNWNGLWLAIVKKICEIFWWKITIDSVEWIWSTFKIDFLYKWAKS